MFYNSLNTMSLFAIISILTLCFNYKNIINILVIATALTEQEIRQDWLWLFENVSPTLHSFDTEEEITEFVCCKINSLIATEQESFTEGMVLSS